MRDSIELKSTGRTLTEDGNCALDEARVRTVTLNFPELTITSRIGLPRLPDAYDEISECHHALGIMVTYTGDNNVLDDRHGGETGWG